MVKRRRPETTRSVQGRGADRSNDPDGFGFVEGPRAEANAPHDPDNRDQQPIGALSMTRRRPHGIGWLAASLAFISGGPLTTGVASPSPPEAWSFDALARLTPLELEALYRTLPAAPILVGRVRGRVLLRPGTRLGPAISKAARVAWQGKVFRGDGTAINRFFGLPAIRADVSEGSSWMDGRPALILDYQHTSRIYASYRDEIRQVAPGIYLGAMYERTCPAPSLALFFALEDDCRSR